MAMAAGQVQQHPWRLPLSWENDDQERMGAVEDVSDLRSEAANHADLVVVFMQAEEVASMLAYSSRKSLAFTARVSMTYSNPGRKPTRTMSCQINLSPKKSQQTSLFLKILDPSISVASLLTEVVIKGEEEEDYESEDDRDDESGNTGNTEEADNTTEEVDMNNVPEREEDMTTKEEELEEEEKDDEDGDEDGRVFKIIHVMNLSIEDEIASLKLSEFSDYGPFVEAVHTEWVKLTGKTPQPEANIVKPWPDFETVYSDADGSPIDIEEKELRWEEFRKVASCVRMFCHLVKIYLVEDNQPKKEVGEADICLLGSYEDLAHVLHLEWARYRGRNPSPNVVDIESSWPGYRITLFGWKDTVTTAINWLNFKRELCFISVKMMDGGATGDEENAETTDKKTSFKIYKVSRTEHLDDSITEEEEIASLNLAQFSAYDSFAEAVHTEWMNHLHRPRVFGIDHNNPWPHFFATYRGAYQRAVDITALSWEEFSRIATSVTMEEEGVSIYLASPVPSSSQAKQIVEVSRVYVFELASYEDLARVLHKAWAQYTGRNSRPEVVDVEKSWPGYRQTPLAQDDIGLYSYPIDITGMEWMEFTETLYDIQVEPDEEMDLLDGTSGSVGHEIDSHGENRDGGGNGGDGNE